MDTLEASFLAEEAAQRAAAKRRTRRLLAISALLHVAVLGGGAIAAHYAPAGPTVVRVEVIPWQATTVVGESGEPETAWTTAGGARWARVTVPAQGQ